MKPVIPKISSKMGLVDISNLGIDDGIKSFKSGKLNVDLVFEMVIDIWAK